MTDKTDQTKQPPVRKQAVELADDHLDQVAGGGGTTTTTTTVVRQPVVYKGREV